MNVRDPGKKRISFGVKKDAFIVGVDEAKFRSLLRRPLAEYGELRMVMSWNKKDIDAVEDDERGVGGRSGAG